MKVCTDNTDFIVTFALSHFNILYKVTKKIWCSKRKTLKNTKSNESLKETLMKTVNEKIENPVDLWKKDVNWDSRTKKEKAVIIWFATSAVLTVSLCWSWLVILPAVSLVCSLASMESIDVEE